MKLNKKIIKRISKDKNKDYIIFLLLVPLFAFSIYGKTFKETTLILYVYTILFMIGEFIKEYKLLKEGCYNLQIKREKNGRKN